MDSITVMWAILVANVVFGTAWIYKGWKKDKVDLTAAKRK